MPETLRVLFVCTGNICRSPMAEGMARALGASEVSSESAGKLEVGSAGISGLDGSPPTLEALLAMRQRDIDIGAHRARSLTYGLLAASDLVLTMEERQSERARAMAPGVPVLLLLRLGEAAAKARGPAECLERLLESATELDRAGAWDLPPNAYEVADPIGMPLEEYSRVADIMQGAIANIWGFMPDPKY